MIFIEKKILMKPSAFRISISVESFSFLFLPEVGSRTISIRTITKKRKPTIFHLKIDFYRIFFSESQFQSKVFIFFPTGSRRQHDGLEHAVVAVRQYPPHAGTVHCDAAPLAPKPRQALWRPAALLVHLRYY